LNGASGARRTNSAAIIDSMDAIEEDYETPIFTKQLLSTLSDEEYRLFQATLLKRPDSGKVIPGGGGLRKVRWTLEGNNPKEQTA
jgi:hypothetical protein